VPTGFDAERLVFLQTTVTDCQGKIVFKSGDLDPNGDVRNEHSVYVHHGRAAAGQSFCSACKRNSSFATSAAANGAGCSVPYGLDPAAVHPAGDAPPYRPGPSHQRPQAEAEPGANSGERWAEYEVKREALCGHGPYTIDVETLRGHGAGQSGQRDPIGRLRLRDESRQIANNIVAGHVLVHERWAVVNIP